MIDDEKIFQGLSPIFLGDFADRFGRRPAFAVCFLLYMAANIGLALQANYTALFVLRCLQSAGISPAMALSVGVISDIATAAERGSYMGLVTAGTVLGPALGPVIGGLLAQYLGWRAIFWFLTILGGAIVIQMLLFFPETARKIVGNGSIAPPKMEPDPPKLVSNYEREDTVYKPDPAGEIQAWLPQSQQDVCYHVPERSWDHHLLEGGRLNQLLRCVRLYPCRLPEAIQLK
ncbi:major facilitator superfamily domain-containing protein [Aspergillus floccosus]